MPFFHELVGRLQSSPVEAGATRTEHDQLFRYLPLLHETGFVRSIAPTHATGAHGPVFAVTSVSRDGSGAYRAYLGLAAAPCDGGDLALVSGPVPLGGSDAVIMYVSPIRAGAGAPLTELQLDVADTPMTTSSGARAKVVHKSVVVGEPSRGVIGMIDALDEDLPPAPGSKVRRHDVHMLGSGWYPLAGGAAYLLVHQIVPVLDDLCQEKPSPLVFFAPPMLRLIARIDSGGFTTDPAKVGGAFVVGIGENQPIQSVYADPERSCRAGPTTSDNRFFKSGSGAQWLWGLFQLPAEAHSRARALGYTTGTVLSTEPPAGANAAKEPWIVPAVARPPERFGGLECGGF